MNKRLLVLVTVLCYAPGIFSQVNDFTNKPDPGIFKQVNNLGWVKFQDSLPVNAADLFSLYPNAFGLSKGFTMRLIKSSKDDIGFVHSKFQQYYYDILITGAEFILHEKNNRLYSGNGKIFTPVIISKRNHLSEVSALRTALNAIASTKGYYWENKAHEAALKKKTGNPAATYFPKATMVYLPAEDNRSILLCYRFFIKAVDFGKSCYCYVNASSGKLEKQLAVEYSCDQTTFISNYNGTQTLFTNDVAVVGNSYDLEDDCQSSIYTVYDATNGNSIFNTPNNQWTTDWQRSAATSLWVIKAAFFWFKNFFGRNGHDNDDADLDIYQGVNFGTAANPNYNNASYSYDEFGIDEIKVGTGNQARVTDDYNAIDILAHEFTHGVTQFEANLVYEKEPGALNESFSDIFGEWVEYKVKGSADWYMGAEKLQNNTCPSPLRSFIDPWGQNVAIVPCIGYAFTQPNTYGGGSVWVPTAGCTPIGPNQPGDNDWCGVHINSGVQNQMFYLLSMGGNGWNNGQTCHATATDGYEWDVAAIGIDKAIRIAYRVLCDYLGSQSTYADARYAWVHAAADLYGECSFEAIQTGKAWNAVGIAPPVLTPPAFPICGNYGSTAVTITKITPVNIANNCAVSILATGNLVNIEAKNTVHIYPGFSASAGSRFRAAIKDDCRFAVF